jgi:hypothetical protein
VRLVGLALVARSTPRNAILSTIGDNAYNFG